MSEERDEQSPAEQSSSSSGGSGPELSFAIAGVGGSAGAIQPLCELVRALRPAAGLAVVVVQHQPRAHPSGLCAILARHAQVPVLLAREGLALTPGRVYVAPHDALLSVQDGAFWLTPRSATAGLEHPIDRLFHALSRQRTKLVAGVVLSGTGSDGSLGVTAIKAAGGVTLVQDGSADFPQMPAAALATGSVDFVLPPPGIASQLQRLAAAPTLRRHEPAEGDEFEQVRARLHPSMAEEKLIHRTRYFRDREALEALGRRAFPSLLSKRADGIRFWVPGCSTGEEVYSLAICLLEFLHRANASNVPLRIFGTDASAEAIATARAAVYPLRIADEVSAGRLRRFFERTNGGYRIQSCVRNSCLFARHDVLHDPPFSRIDLVSYRNLMIYLDPLLQQRLLPIFHYALREPGFLLLGSAESTRGFQGFASLDDEHQLFTRVPLERRSV